MCMFVDRCLFFCTFSLGHYVVCSSSIYGVWLLLWYLQTLLHMSGWMLVIDTVPLEITPLKTGGELRCSGEVSSSCSTSGIRRVNLVTNLVISHEWGKDREVFYDKWNVSFKFSFLWLDLTGIQCIIKNLCNYPHFWKGRWI
jgi:hypothetical protein